MLKKITFIICCSLIIFILPTRAQQTINLNLTRYKFGERDQNLRKDDKLYIHV